MVKLLNRKLKETVALMEELELLLNSDDDISIFDPSVALRVYTSGGEDIATTDIWLSIELEPMYGDNGIPVEIIDRIKEIAGKYGLEPLAINVSEYGLVEIVLAYETSGRALRGEGEVEEWEKKE